MKMVLAVLKISVNKWPKKAPDREKYAYLLVNLKSNPYFWID